MFSLIFSFQSGELLPLELKLGLTCGYEVVAPLPLFSDGVL